MEVFATFGFISWLIFGALAGWIASLIAGTNDRQGCLTNIVVGIIGAFVGGLVVNLVTGRAVILEWNLPSFIVAVVGSLILLAVVRAVRR